MRPVLLLAPLLGLSGCNCGYAAAACHPGMVTDGDGNLIKRYVVNKLVLPESRTDFAIDLNCDGHADNQFGNVIGALEAQAIDLQTPVDFATSGGDPVTLIEVRTADDALAHDDAIAVRFLPGAAAPMPDFMGDGTFTVDQSLPASDELLGVLDGGRFSSNAPDAPPVSLLLRLKVDEDVTLPLPLVGAHVQFVAGKDLATDAPGLVNGQIHGAVRRQDVERYFVPAGATIFTKKLQASNGMMYDSLDVGGCTNGDGTMAVAHDLRIDPCEFAQYQITRSVLAPDVQLFDEAGDYAPNPKNTAKDSFSVGIAFTAVAAQF